jgi:hypothetical protein
MNQFTNFTRPLAIAAAGFALLLAGTGCDEDGPINSVGRPIITAVPASVSFAEVPIGTELQQTVQLSNEGDGTLIIPGYDWGRNSDDFRVEGLEQTLRIEPNESAYITVFYLPSDEEPDSSVLTLENNDPRQTRGFPIPVVAQGQGAILIATPAEVAFSVDQPDIIQTQDVELRNIGSSTFEVTDVALVADNGEFIVEGPATPFDLGPQETVMLTVTYAPAAAGTDSDQIVLECDAGNCTDGYFFIPINGLTEAPRLRLTPGDVTFGAVSENPDPIPTQILTARNDGSGVLEISSIAWLPNTVDTTLEFAIVSIGGVAFDPANAPWNLSGGEELELVISYTPEDALPDLELLEFRSNDDDLPQQRARITGRLSAPQLEVSPERLEFPLTARNRSSERTVTIRNAGAEPLEMEYILARGGGFTDDTFVLLNDGAMPAILGPGEQFELNVAFAPTLANLDFTGTIFVGVTNDPVRPEARVDVVGVSTTDPVCRVRTLPPTLDFGVVPRGSRRELTGRLQNNGSGTCRINSAQKQTSFFGVIFSDFFEFVGVFGPAGQAPPFELAPGEEATIVASYFPTSVTDLGESPFGDTASIEVRVVDVDNPAATVTCGAAPPFFGGGARDCGVNLQARSAVASIGVIPGDIDFGPVTLGCNSQTQTIRVYNTGGADVDIASIALDGTCSSEFALAGVPAMPAIIRRGDSIPFQVRYRPTDEGNDTCLVVIESTAEGGGRFVVPIEGLGVLTSARSDRFEQVSGRDVDVLFVVDNSGSMSEEQSNLARNFSSFIAAARTWGSNFQLGVVTTQTAGNIPDPTGGNRQPGELLGSPRIMTPTTPGLDSVFPNTVRVGAQNSSESSSERGLESAYLTLTDPLITDLATSCSGDAECGGAPYICKEGATSARGCGGFNRTFLRESASLEIVFLSDEEDSSRAELNFYIDFFRSIKGFRNTSLFHASAIVTPRGGCGSGSSGEGVGDRYIEVANQTGGEVGSICDTNFASILTDIGNRAFGLRVDFYLTSVPVPGSISVQSLSSCSPTATPSGTLGGWTYDSTANSILFADGSAPEPGDCFVVNYEAACF